MRLQMEALLHKYEVDIVFSGHVHAYERMNRVYNYTLDPCGAVYITVGDGGNIEKVDVDHADEEGTCPSPSDNVPEFGGVCHTNFSFGVGKGGFCWDRQPEWRAYRESSFGHGIGTRISTRRTAEAIRFTSFDSLSCVWLDLR
ncbi:purple acid phosphatase 15-like [Salvia splendens]|uniref:purple acid phosphatase 15-like n=1 Tax=Salvia splendens TaxID=180675 RepID=UPI001C25EE5A|nr:purple acid phosphatase 15-like [Salvia splendens]